MDPAVKAHTQLVQLKMPKPANLPFHLLAWGAEYVKNYNCGLMLHEKGKKTKRKLEKIKNESNTDNKIENDNADKSYIGRILSNIMMPISNIKWNFVPSVSLKSEVEEKVEEKVEKTVATSDVDITSIVSTKSLNIPVEPDVSATDVVMTAKGMGDSSIGLRSVDASTGTGVSTGVGASAQTGGAFMTNVNTTTLPHSSAAESSQTLHHNKNENNEKKDNKIDGFESGIIISVNNDVDVSTSKSYVSDHPLMAICGLKGTAQHRGAVINMTYFRPSIIHTLRYGKNSEYENTVPAVLKSADTGRVTHKRTKTSEKNIKRIELEENKVKNEEITEEKLKENKEGTGKEGGKAGTKVEVKMKVKEKLNENNRKTHSDWSRNRKLKKRHDIVPIQFIYYTECDQIVKYDTMGTLKAFSSALNESTFLTGRRREKSPETSAVDYMGGKYRAHVRMFVFH